MVSTPVGNLKHVVLNDIVDPQMLQGTAHFPDHKIITIPWLTKNYGVSHDIVIQPL